MKVVLDTSGWYAFILKTDKFHQIADQFFKIKPNFLITYPVFEELTALIHHREGKKITVTTVEIIRDSILGQIVYLTRDDDVQIWNIYKITAKQIDYVDASVIWLSKKLKLPVFTFDKHFKNLGINLIPEI